MSKTSTGLVEYAKAQLGKPYWFGTFGQIATANLWSEKSKQYPKYYSSKREGIMNSRGDLGKKVHDCLGLWKGYMMSESPDAPAVYNKDYDYSADSIFDKATEKGPISTLPDIPGIGLHKKGHFGVYIGGGKEIEARGFDFGVIEDIATVAGFTEWFKIPFIDYGESAAPVEEPVNQTVNDVTEDDGLYTVVAGDTLTKLAERWGTNVKAIAELNGIKNPDVIITGQKLKIPEANQLPTWLGIVATKKDPLNVRSGRGTNFPIVKQLPKGSMAELTGSNLNGWYKLADGSGYVSAKFIVRM